jgi:GT2 family glycosyltransferase
MKPTFSFIIVTYNNADTIGPCLRSIAAFTSDSYEAIVVDNSPDDETALAVQCVTGEQPGLPIQLVKSGQNLGFSCACNAGARLARGELLFFLNPDTRLLNDAGRLLSDCFAQHPRAVAAGPSISNATGVVTRTCRNLPTLGRIFLDVMGLDRWLGWYKLTRFAHDVPKTVEQIIGAALLIRHSTFDTVGGMDERFFVYYEEVDLCKRLREAGGQVWFWPRARVQHISGTSCEADPVRAKMIYTLRESRTKYFCKHFGPFSAFAIRFINRLEGMQKALILQALWLVRGRSSYREKAHGFWSVAKGTAPSL